MLLLPWLVVTMLELVVVGLPALIFCGLLSLYLYFKVKSQNTEVTVLCSRKF